MFPENDNQYQEHRIESVQTQGDGHVLGLDDSGGLFVQAYEGVPKVGDTLRCYGKGFGYPIRGIFIDGVKVRYQTEEEYKQSSLEQQYGKDAEDWLKRWDNGEGVPSVEMGGMGPCYEQAIQITAAEILRDALKNFKSEEVESDEAWEAMWEEINERSFKNPMIKSLGLSGAQYGAARSVAAMIFKRGPIAALSDEKVKDRRISVRKYFPSPKFNYKAEPILDECERAFGVRVPALVDKIIDMYEEQKSRG